MGYPLSMSLIQMRTIVKFVIAVLICSQASNSQWTKLQGPEGGNCSALINLDNHIYAGTTMGVYRSSTGGATWVSSGFSSFYGTVYSFAKVGKRIFAGGYGVVAYSSDSGENWNSSGKGLPIGIIFSLATRGDTVFAGTSNSGIFRSLDQGESWRALDNAPSSKVIKTLSIQGRYLFAGTDNGLFRSPDGGETWIRTDSGIAIPAIEAVNVQGGIIIASVNYKSVYRSIDSGRTWVSISTGLSLGECVKSIAWVGNVLIGAVGGHDRQWNFSFAGQWRHLESGESWSKVSYCQCHNR